MTKKIKGRGKASSTTPVQAPRTIESAKVGEVDQVKGTEAQKNAKGVGQAGQKITPEMREKIMQLIDEEADKMFGGPNGLPEEKKDTLKNAVKMAINSSELEEE